MPVPPPIPAVMKTMSVPSSTCAMALVDLLGRLLADFGLGACAHAAGQLFADLDLVLAGRLVQILLIGVDCDKLNALYAGRDHSVDNVVAGAADADDFNLNNLFC